MVTDLHVWLYEQIESRGFRRYAGGHGGRLTMPGVKVVAGVGWRDFSDDEAAVALGWSVTCTNFVRQIREHRRHQFWNASPASLREIYVRGYFPAAGAIPCEFLDYAESLSRIVSELREVSRDDLELLKWCEGRMPWPSGGGLVKYDFIEQYYAICCMHAMYGTSERAHEIMRVIDSSERDVGTDRERSEHSRKWLYLRDVFMPWAEARRA